MNAPQAPFPWFGGKSRAASTIWAALGDVPNYVEPFAGSLGAMLARPGGAGKIETVNDLDGFVANFWRAVSLDPEAVACHADWPVNEADLHARHLWLVDHRADITSHLMGDPDWFDVKVAGWWVWGACSWIGSGWCSGEGPWHSVDGRLVNLSNAGKGVNRQLPHLSNAGQGVNRQLPHLSNAGQGVNRKLPHLGDAGRGVNRKLPHLGDAGRGITDWMLTLANRLRRTRVACGDWERVVSESVTTRHGLTGVLLDPPYGGDVTEVYAHDDISGQVALAAREWALANGDNPLLRIAFCSYVGAGHEVLEAAGWTRHDWTTSGGYGGGRGGRGDDNRHREAIWFSPHCIGVLNVGLFGSAS